MLQTQNSSEMKLSHAIREGAKLKLQSICRRNHVGSSSVQGAAADDALPDFFPELADQVPGGRRGPTAHATAAHMRPKQQR
jgi:hypothetical protein